MKWNDLKCINAAKAHGYSVYGACWYAWEVFGGGDGQNRTADLRVMNPPL